MCSSAEADHGAGNELGENAGEHHIARPPRLSLRIAALNSSRTTPVFSEIIRRRIDSPVSFSFLNYSYLDDLLPLAQTAGGHIHAGDGVHIGVALQVTVNMPQGGQVFHREEAPIRQRGVQARGRVALGKNKPVPVLVLSF